MDRSMDNIGTTSASNGNTNSTSAGLNAMGRLAPAVSVGGNPLDRGAQSSSPFSYNLENGGGAGTEDLVEHDYGDTGGQAEVGGGGGGEGSVGVSCRGGARGWGVERS